MLNDARGGVKKHLAQRDGVLLGTADRPDAGAPGALQVQRVHGWVDKARIAQRGAEAPL